MVKQWRRTAKKAEPHESHEDFLELTQQADDRSTLRQLAEQIGFAHTDTKSSNELRRMIARRLATNPDLDPWEGVD